MVKRSFKEWKIDKDASCPCRSGKKFKECCALTINTDLKDKAFYLLSQKKYEKAEIAFRSFLTQYIKWYNEHTVPVVKDNPFRIDDLLRVDIDAISSAVEHIAYCLKFQNKKSEIDIFLQKSLDIIDDDRYLFNISYLRAALLAGLDEKDKDKHIFYFSDPQTSSILITQKEIFELLIWALKMLREPAGDDIKFSSLDSIKKNYDEFLKKTHESWKWLHYITIKEIMVIDQAIKIAKKKNLKKSLIKDYFYYRLILRRINDSIVWLMTRLQRHIIKRICFYREHGFLANQNPMSVLMSLVYTNSDPYTIAIWNDATNCVDVGDILSANVKKGKFYLIEVKEGQVNEEMLSTAHCDRALYFFLRKHGKKGKEQLLRNIKQIEKALAVEKLLKEEEGIDPITKQKIKIIESKVLDESYDAELRDIIKNAKEHKEDFKLIDQCLWLYVTSEKPISFKEAKERFSHIILSNDDGSILKWQREYLNMETIYPIFSLQENAFHPESFPIFLREIKDEDIIDITFGHLKILLYLDWNGLSNLFEEYGLKLMWSSKKEGRREKTKSKYERLFILGDRIPIVSKREIKIQIGGGTIGRILIDGIRPKVICEQFKESIENNFLWVGS